MPRLLGRAPGGLRGSRVELPAGGEWRDALSERSFHGGSVDGAELLSRFPVALLVRR